MTTDAQTQILELPPFVLPRDALAEKLRVASSPRKCEELFAMIDKVESLARPVVYCRRLEPVFEGEEAVVLGGHRIPSATMNKVFRKALPLADGSNAVFAFAATCGQEATDWGAAQEFGLPTFWAQTILEHGMYFLIAQLEKELGKFSDAAVSTIEPGIPTDWPLSAQTGLFEILGGTSEDFGIRLNDQSLMLPFRYLAGICFFTKRILPSCTYCHFVDCNRKRGGCWRLQALKRRAPELAAEAAAS